MSKTVCIELTLTEASALMEMLERDMDSQHTYGSGIDINDMDSVENTGHELLAYHKYRTWYIQRMADSLDGGNDEQISD